MATVTWDAMLPQLAPFIPAAPDTTMRSALATAASEFLAATHIWRQTIDPVPTQRGESTYELYADAVIESILTMRHDGIVLRSLHAERLDPFSEAEGRPTHFWRVADNIVRLFPLPDAAGLLEAYVAVKPSVKSPGVEDWIVDTWGGAIVDGAIWHLARVPSKPWSDIQMAQEHKQRFDRATAQARIRDTRQCEMRVALRRF